MDFRRYRARIVEDERALECIAASIVLERRRELAGIFERFAQCELGMQPILVIHGTARKLVAHRVDIAPVETEGFKICETRIRATAPGSCHQRPLVHGDRPCLLADLAQ